MRVAAVNCLDARAAPAGGGALARSAGGAWFDAWEPIRVGVVVVVGVGGALGRDWGRVGSAPLHGGGGRTAGGGAGAWCLGRSWLGAPLLGRGAGGFGGVFGCDKPVVPAAVLALEWFGLSDGGRAGPRAYGGVVLAVAFVRASLGLVWDMVGVRISSLRMVVGWV